MSKTEFDVFSLIELETFSEVDNYCYEMKVHLLACSGLPVMIWYLMVSLMYCYFCSKDGPLWSCGKASIELRKWVCPISKGTLEYNDYPDIYQSINSKNIIILWFIKYFTFNFTILLLINKFFNFFISFLSKLKKKIRGY